VCSAYTSQTKSLPQPRSYTKIVQYVSKTLPIYEAALRKLEGAEAAVERCRRCEGVSSRPTAASQRQSAISATLRDGVTSRL